MPWCCKLSESEVRTQRTVSTKFLTVSVSAHGCLSSIFQLCVQRRSFRALIYPSQQHKVMQRLSRDHSKVRPSCGEALCHVNTNESSQDFNGNIISCLFVLYLALTVQHLVCSAAFQFGRQVKDERQQQV
ncbi:hypothetical protein XENORESO_018042 [Xenotaenia resolanae]|uniref:Uncharacterized protein n=1 Tax=Xenotaenia resolanae TaxID=208358 RepID=A0ABV0W5L5_9TELE